MEEVKDKITLSERNQLYYLRDVLYKVYHSPDRELRAEYESKFHKELLQIHPDPVAAIEYLQDIAEKLCLEDEEETGTDTFNPLLKKIGIGCWILFFIIFQYILLDDFGFWSMKYWLGTFFLIVFPWLIVRFVNFMTMVNEGAEISWKYGFYELLQKYKEERFKLPASEQVTYKEK